MAAALTHGDEINEFGHPYVPAIWAIALGRAEENSALTAAATSTLLRTPIPLDRAYADAGKVTIDAVRSFASSEHLNLSCLALSVRQQHGERFSPAAAFLFDDVVTSVLGADKTGEYRQPHEHCTPWPQDQLCQFLYGAALRERVAALPSVLRGASTHTEVAMGAAELLMGIIGLQFPEDAEFFGCLRYQLSNAGGLPEAEELEAWARVSSQLASTDTTPALRGLWRDPAVAGGWWVSDKAAPSITYWLSPEGELGKMGRRVRKNDARIDGPGDELRARYLAGPDQSAG